MESRLSCRTRPEPPLPYFDFPRFFIQEIYGKIPTPEPAVTCDQWIRGAVEKPHSRQLPSNSRGLSSLQSHAASTETHLLTPADMKGFLRDFRNQRISSPRFCRRSVGGAAVGAGSGTGETGGRDRAAAGRGALAHDFEPHGWRERAARCGTAGIARTRERRVGGRDDGEPRRRWAEPRG